MRLALTTLVIAAFFGAARADGAVDTKACLAPGEVQEIVLTDKVISPATAVNTARQRVPGADVVRANLCRDGQTLVYIISALRKDGRVVRVVIDAPTGRVLASGP
jgi:uncharacterized membrane protein YkoI